MEFTLEDLSQEFPKRDPRVEVTREGDGVRVRTEGVYLVPAIQALIVATQMLEEDMTDEDRAQLDAWFAED